MLPEEHWWNVYCLVELQICSAGTWIHSAFCYSQNCPAVRQKQCNEASTVLPSVIHFSEYNNEV